MHVVDPHAYTPGPARLTPVESLRTIFDAAFEFVGLLSPDGILLEANRAALDFGGVQREDVVGLPFWETVWWKRHPQAQAQLREGIAAAARGRFVRYEVEQVGADGRVAIVDFSLKPVLDDAGEVVGIVPEGRDVSERRRAERAAEAERTRLLARETEARAAAEAAERRAAFLSDASALLDESLDYRETLTHLAHLVVPSLASYCVVDVIEDGQVRRMLVEHADPAMREAAAALLSYPRDPAHPFATRVSLQGSRPVLVTHVTDEHLREIAYDARHLELLRAFAPVSYLDLPLQARGTLLGAICMGIDASWGHCYGHEDLLLAEEVARRAALALDNARLYQEAQRATRLRDEMLSVVSHDLRTPLSVIGMSLRALDGTADHSGPGDRALAARTIRDSLDWLQRMLQDLLDVASIEAGRLHMEIRQQDPIVTLMRAIELFDATAREHGITLVADVPEHLPSTCLDGERMLQVLSNLLGNAIKFTERGGTVVLSAATRDDELHVAVRDSGAGIPPAELPHVFDRFWHARRGSSARGTGLGLTISRGIADAHGGRIEVTSTPGHGSEFRVIVPLRCAPETREECAPPAG